MYNTQLNHTEISSDTRQVDWDLLQRNSNMMMLSVVLIKDKEVNKIDL